MDKLTIMRFIVSSASVDGAGQARWRVIAPIGATDP
jgi:hypothetical protein